MDQDKYEKTIFTFSQLKEGLYAEQPDWIFTPVRVSSVSPTTQRVLGESWI